MYKNNIKDDCLTISTIHSAKGLEWNSVFIIGAVDGRFPSAYSFNSKEEMEEELRLMYVATTRAKSDLFIKKFNDLKTMLESEDVDGMRRMMRHSTERRALFDKK